MVANALLYVFALLLAVAVMGPIGEERSRRSRIARGVLIVDGGLAVAAAVALAFLGMWFESALAGTAEIVVVGACLCVGLAREGAPAEDEEDEDDDGGSLHRPAPPEPTMPEGGPSDEFWTEFDAARAGWARECEPSSA